MKRIKTFLCFIMAAILLTSCGSEVKEHSGQNENIASNKDASSEERIQKKLSVTKDFDGFVMSVESDRDTYKTGESFVLTASVTNNSGKSVYIERRDDCVLSGELSGDCRHHEIFTRLEKGDMVLIDADTFGKGVNDADMTGEFKSGNTIIQKMNYLAGNCVHVDEFDLNKIKRHEIAQIGDIDGGAEKIVLAEPGIYHGTCKVVAYEDQATHESNYSIYTLEFSIEITE